MNKGEIVKRLLKNRNTENSLCDFVFCAGDDRTDEDMFKAIKKSEGNDEHFHTCTIGPANKKTFAKWHVPSPQNIIDLVVAMSKLSQ